jgi:chromosome segregation ATPase
MKAPEKYKIIGQFEPSKAEFEPFKKKRGRPAKNKPRVPSKDRIAGLEETIKTLREALEHAGNVSEQASDQISDLQSQVEWYRKQVNHFLALLNILVRGQ